MHKHYIDWLRNLGILFLFVFHTARIFDSLEANYVKGVPDPVSNGIVISSYWFMPLLFLLAGMSAYFALRKYSAKEFLKERARRLLIPFIFGLVAVVPPQAYIACHTGVRQTLSGPRIQIYGLFQPGGVSRLYIASDVYYRDRLFCAHAERKYALKVSVDFRFCFSCLHIKLRRPA